MACTACQEQNENEFSLWFTSIALPNLQCQSKTTELPPASKSHRKETSDTGIVNTVKKDLLPPHGPGQGLEPKAAQASGDSVHRFHQQMGHKETGLVTSLVPTMQGREGEGPPEARCSLLFRLNSMHVLCKSGIIIGFYKGKKIWALTVTVCYQKIMTHFVFFKNELKVALTLREIRRLDVG